MVHPTRMLVVLVFVALASCKCGSKAATSGELPSPVDGATAELFSVVGDRGLAVFSFRDAGWEALRESIEAAAGGEIEPFARPMTNSRDPIAGVWAVASAIRLDLGEPPTSLVGRDEARPIIFSVMEPPFFGPPGLAVALMGSAEDQHPPLRHQLVVPASDVGALVASLRMALEIDAEPAPELVVGKAGAVGLTRPSIDPAPLHLAILPADGYVRVVFLEGAIGWTPSELRRWTNVDPAAFGDTPAMRVAGSQRPLTAYLRPWQLRGATAWRNLYEGHRMLTWIYPDQRTMGRIGALQAAGGHVAFMLDDGAEFDDWGLGAMGGHDGLRIVTVASLTEQGQRLWNVIASSTSRPFELRRAVSGELFVGADFSQMIGVAAARERPRQHVLDVFESFRACGRACEVFAASRWPLGAMKTLTGAPPGLWLLGGIGVSSVHIALIERGSSDASWAVAVTGSQAREEQMGPLLEFFWEEVEIHEKTRGGSAVVLAGEGIDPRDVFDIESQRGESTVGLFRADAAATNLSAEMRARVRLSGPAVILEMVIGAGELESGPSFEGLSWSTPVQMRETGEGARCLRDAMNAYGRHIGGATRINPAIRHEVYSSIPGEVKEALACAQRDAHLVGAARRYADTIAVLAARSAAERLELGHARAVLQERCVANEHGGAACEELERLGAFAEPEWMSLEGVGACGSDETMDSDLPIFFREGRLLIGGESIPATRQAFIEAVVDRTPTTDRWRRKGPRLSLLAAPGVPFGRLVPLFQGAAAMNTHLDPLVLDEGERFAIASEIEWTGTSIVDWKALEGEISDAPGHAQPLEMEVERGEGPLHFRLSRDALVANLPDGTEIDVATSRQVVELTRLARDRYLKATIEVESDVPWGRYVALAAGSCSSMPTLLVR